MKINPKCHFGVDAHDEGLRPVKVPFVNWPNVARKHRPPLPVEQVAETAVIVFAQAVAIVTAQVETHFEELMFE